jgi:uncharacterized membrane protein YdjX (TVP38/TMEM64 family)
MRRVLGIALFCCSFAIAAAVILQKHALDALLAQAGPGAYPIAIVLLAVVAAAPFSVTDALAVSNGVLFGPILGSLVNAAGLVAGSVLGYVVARRTSSLLDVEAQLNRLPPAVRRFPAGSPLFLILVRIIPGVGGTLATQLAAALRVPMLRHVLTFCAVTVPFCTVLAFGGNAISHEVHHLWTGLRHPHHQRQD